MLIIPAILSTFTSLKDKTLKLVFETNEVTPEQMTNIAKNLQQFGYLAFKQENFNKSDTDTLDSLDTKYQSKGKSCSQRLRNVLFVKFEQDNNGFKTFNDFYDSEMNIIIEHFKNKLD